MSRISLLSSYYKKDTSSRSCSRTYRQSEPHCSSATLNKDGTDGRPNYPKHACEYNNGTSNLIRLWIIILTLSEHLCQCCFCLLVAANTISQIKKKKKGLAAAPKQTKQLKKLRTYFHEILVIRILQAPAPLIFHWLRSFDPKASEHVP